MGWANDIFEADPYIYNSNGDVIGTKVSNRHGSIFSSYDNTRNKYYKTKFNSDVDDDDDNYSSYNLNKHINHSKVNCMFRYPGCSRTCMGCAKKYLWSK